MTQSGCSIRQAYRRIQATDAAALLGRRTVVELSAAIGMPVQEARELRELLVLGYHLPDAIAVL